MERSTVGVAGSSALIPIQHNNKQDYKQEQKKKLQKDGEGEGADGWDWRIILIKSRRLATGDC